MEKITDPLNLTLEEINYRMEGLQARHLEILQYLTRGKTDAEAAELLGITMPTFTARLASACDRAGVDRRAQLIALYSVWTFERSSLARFPRAMRTELDRLESS